MVLIAYRDVFRNQYPITDHYRLVCHQRGPVTDESIFPDFNHPTARYDNALLSDTNATAYSQPPAVGYSDFRSRPNMRRPRNDYLIVDDSRNQDPTRAHQAPSAYEN